MGTADKSKYPMVSEDSEAAYDEHVAPLMKKVIALCKEHRIPVFATFQLTSNDDGNDVLLCTTRIPFNGESDKFDRAHDATKNHYQKPFVLKTFGADGELKAIEHIWAPGDGGKNG